MYLVLFLQLHTQQHSYDVISVLSSNLWKENMIQNPCFPHLCIIIHLVSNGYSFLIQWVFFPPPFPIVLYLIGNNSIYFSISLTLCGTSLQRAATAEKFPSFPVSAFFNYMVKACNFSPSNSRPLSLCILFVASLAYSISLQYTLIYLINIYSFGSKSINFE